jgi:hypothetical protein
MGVPEVLIYCPLITKKKKTKTPNRLRKEETKNSISLQSSTYASRPLLISHFSTFCTRMFTASSNEPSTNCYNHTLGPIFLTRILILSSHLPVCLLRGLFAPGFPAKWVCTCQSIACYMPYLLAHYFITLIVSG